MGIFLKMNAINPFPPSPKRSNEVPFMERENESCKLLELTAFHSKHSGLVTLTVLALGDTSSNFWTTPIKPGREEKRGHL